MKCRAQLLGTLLAAGALLPLASPAAAYVGYAANGELGVFVQMSVPDGTVTYIALQPPTALSGVAISPAGELFGVAWFNDPFPRLARVDPVSGQVELRGPLALGPAGSYPDLGLAFDGRGRLWLMTIDGKLYEVDTASAVAALRLDLGMRVESLAGCGTSLFGLSQPPFGEKGPLRLVRIEPDQGTFTAVGAGISAVQADDGAGLDFTADGRLWGLLRDLPPIPVPFKGNSLVELDPRTGELVSASFFDGQWYNGLALAPPPARCLGEGTPEVPSLGRSGLWVLAGMLSLVAMTLLRAWGRRPTPR